MNPSSPADRSPSRPAQANSGLLAEDLVARWLVGQGWTVLSRRWRCRWGELDLVASALSPDPTLIFVEVKARSRGNWDENGLLAITLQKQAKLRQTAELFLMEHPQFAEFSCRFDVALVQCRQQLGKKGRDALSSLSSGVELHQPIVLEPYQLTLQHYIEAAFH